MVIGYWLINLIKAINQKNAITYQNQEYPSANTLLLKEFSKHPNITIMKATEGVILFIYFYSKVWLAFDSASNFHTSETDLS